MNNGLDFALPRLYAITDTQLSGLSHTAQVAALCAGGAKLVQLRAKGLSAEEFARDARQALQIARQHQARIIINDRVDVALAVGADGVHLGQDDLPVEQARRLLGKTAIIGLSTHNLDQALTATSQPIDYLAVGPIFATVTKSDTEAVVGLDGLRVIRARTLPTPMVAIGGIQASNAADVLGAGADSVAIISSLVGDSSAIERRTAQFLQAISH